MACRSTVPPPAVRRLRARPPSRLDEPMTDGEERQLRLIGDRELLFDVVEMRSDGRGRELQVLRDPRDALAPSEAHEHLELSLGEPLDRRLRRPFEVREREPLGERHIEIAPPG